MTTPDFTKIWASESPLTPYTFDDDEYLEGWATIGEIPPDRRQFDEWQRQADTKMLWLKNNMLGYLLRQNSTEYQAGDIAFSASLPSYLVLECTTAGTTAATEPDFSGAVEKDTVTDGTVVWTYRNILSGNGGGVPVGFILPYAAEGLEEGFLECDGSAVSRTMYPDLFAKLGTKWGAGDGSTTFNLPRSEDLVFQGASATNPVGTYKTAGLPNIEGTVGLPYYDNGATNTGAFSMPTVSARNYAGSGSGSNVQTGTFDASRSNPIYGNSNTVQPPAACVRYMIKAFDGPTPSSAGIDLTQYAQDLANKADRSLSNLNATGEDHFLERDFTIIYPNGGTEANPANIAVNSRYVETNPFPGYIVNCIAEVFVNSSWENTGWFSYTYNNANYSRGVAAHQQNDDSIIIQTGITNSVGDGGASGSTIPSEVFYNYPMPCRVKVWKIGKVASA